jgi:pimeloyl-ACP methyl ester carboxylesterase
VVKQHIQSSLYIVENCGHVVNVEQPENFNIKTIDFLKAIPS